MLTRCHGSSVRLMRWTFALYLVANAKFHIHVISACLANTQAT